MLPMGGAYSLQLETDVSIMYRGSTVEGRDLERTQEFVQKPVVVLRPAAVGHAETQLRFGDR